MATRKKRIFNNTIILNQLNAIPIINGSIYVKWKLDSNCTMSKQKSGYSRAVQVQNHNAVWGDVIEFTTMLSVNERYDEIN